MNRLALLLAALILAATGCRSADTTDGEARPSLLERMTPSMKLPQELIENAVVIPVANVRTSRNPLAFSPYRVTSMKRGWRRTSDPSFGQIWIGEKKEREPFSFILQREGEDLWNADCRWASSSIEGGWSDEDEEIKMESRRAVSLRCLLSGLGTAASAPWSLELDIDRRSPPSARTPLSRGSLSSEDRELGIVADFSGSAIASYDPTGYLFSDSEGALAAVDVTRAGRMIFSSDLDSEDLDLLAAASAALALMDEAAFD